MSLIRAHAYVCAHAPGSFSFANVSRATFLKGPGKSAKGIKNLPYTTGRFFIQGRPHLSEQRKNLGHL